MSFLTNIENRVTPKEFQAPDKRTLSVHHDPIGALDPQGLKFFRLPLNSFHGGNPKSPFIINAERLQQKMVGAVSLKAPASIDAEIKRGESLHLL